MYHLMSEIKNQQKVLDRRIKKLLEQLESQQHSKKDSDLIKEIKKQQTILDEKMLALIDLFELCHDKISPPDEKECCKKDCHHKKQESQDHPEVEVKKLDEKQETKIEPKPLKHDLPLPKENVGPEQPQLGELTEGLGLHPLRLPPETQKLDESSEHEPLDGHIIKTPGQHPSGLPPVHHKLEETLKSENEPNVNNQTIEGNSPQLFTDNISEKTNTTAHGFAYSKVEGIESGVVKLNIAGPLQNMELVTDGLRVGNAGVYQVNYSVVLIASIDDTEKAKFQMVINDKITIDSSTTESALSQQVSSTQLFSFMEGDVVKLVAEIPEGMGYSQATLQLIQIA